jgi:hypothetical protein
MKIKYNPEDQRFDVPAGTYLVRFEGTRDKPPIKDSKYGGSDEPRMGWRFKVLGPPGNQQVGKVIEQETGTYPSPKSKLVYLLNLMLGGSLQPGQEVDVEGLAGRTYQLVWAVNPASEKGNPHVAALVAAEVPAEGRAGADNGRQAATSVSIMTPAQDIPPPLHQPMTPAMVGDLFWVVREPGEDPAKMHRTSLQEFIRDRRKDPKTVKVCPLGTTVWKTAAELGFADGVPF